MDVFQQIEETQKRLFNNSAIVQYEDLSYIYPQSAINNQNIKSNALNRYYKGDIKNKMFNIYDDDLRIFDMIEHMNNKKTLERLRKAKEIQREKLREEIFNEDGTKMNFVRKNNINLSNFEEKLKSKMFISDHGSNIMYMLMKFLLNRRKVVRKRKINEKINNLYSQKGKEFYKDKLNKLINNNSIYSQSNKSNNSSNNINTIHFGSSSNSHMNTKRKGKSFPYNKNEIKKSKSYLDLKSIPKDNYSEISISNDKRKTDYVKKYEYNKCDDINLNDKNEINEIINQEKLNSADINKLDKEEKNKEKEETLFKHRLAKKRLNSFNTISINLPNQRKEIYKKFNYINGKKLESIKKKNESKIFGFSRLNINNNPNRSCASQFDLQKEKWKIYSNLNNISDKIKEIKNQIKDSYRNDSNKNIQEEKEIINKSDFTTSKNENNKTSNKSNEEKENVIKLNEKNIMYSNKSNYSLAQTNLHFFGKKKQVDEIDNFKQNLSLELRKEIIKQNRNLLKINIKHIIKKFVPRHKFDE